MIRLTVDKIKDHLEVVVVKDEHALLQGDLGLGGGEGGDEEQEGDGW